MSATGSWPAPELGASVARRAHWEAPTSSATSRQRVNVGCSTVRSRLERSAARRCNPVVARAVALVSVLAMLLVLASPVNAAAPNYILVSCPGVKRPVMFANWTENHALLIALVDAPKANAKVVRGLARRPRCDLAEFWGWGDRPQPTRPGQANQHGSFYPARRQQPAIFELMVDGTNVPRLAPMRALRILARHGVPTRIWRSRQAPSATSLGRAI